MSEFATCRILYANDPPEGYTGDAWLEIVQPETPEKPDGGFIGWIVSTGKQITLATVSEYFNKYKSPCSEDGSIEIEIQVHKSQPDLAYEIEATYGELSGAAVAGEPVKEQIIITGLESYQIKREVSGSISASWQKGVFTLKGRLDQGPDVAQDGNILDFGQKVWGVLELEYTASPDTYILTITPRPEGDFDPDYPETAYKSVVTAIWAGEPQQHEVELPEMSGYCGGGSTATINPDDDGNCYDLHVTRHKCTNEIVSEKLVPVPCPG